MIINRNFHPPEAGVKCDRVTAALKGRRLTVSAILGILP